MLSRNSTIELPHKPAQEARVTTRSAEHSSGRKNGYAVGPEIAALTRYYDDHSEDLRRYAYVIVKDHALAEDVVQQAFLNTLSSLERGTSILSLSAWMHRCVRNLALEQLRHGPTQELDEASHIATPLSTIDELHVRERWRSVTKAIDLMPNHYRETFLMAELKGLSYEEIASATDRSVGSIRQILRRARKHVHDIAGPDAVPQAWPLAGFTALRHGIGALARKVRTVDDRIATKLRDLNRWFNLLIGRFAESLSAPVTALMAGAMVVAVTAGPQYSPAALFAPQPSGTSSTSGPNTSRSDLETGPLAQGITQYDSGLSTPTGVSAPLADGLDASRRAAKGLDDAAASAEQASTGLALKTEYLSLPGWLSLPPGYLSLPSTWLVPPEDRQIASSYALVSDGGSQINGPRLSQSGASASGRLVRQSNGLTLGSSGGRGTLAPTSRAAPGSTRPSAGSSRPQPARGSPSRPSHSPQRAPRPSSPKKTKPGPTSKPAPVGGSKPAPGPTLKPEPAPDPGQIVAPPKPEIGPSPGPSEISKPKPGHLVH